MTVQVKKRVNEPVQSIAVDENAEVEQLVSTPAPKAASGSKSFLQASVDLCASTPSLLIGSTSV